MNDITNLSEEGTQGICPFVDTGEYHLTSKIKAAYVVIGILSIVSATFVFTTIFSVK